jgi:hypothetical protein
MAASSSSRPSEGRGIMAQRHRIEQPESKPGIVHRIQELIPQLRPRRKAANKALNTLWNIPLAESGGESNSESDSADSSTTDASENSSTSSSEEICGSDMESDTENIEQQDEAWIKLNTGTVNRFATGRIPAHNVFKENAGVKASSKAKIHTELDAFRLFINQKITQQVYQCTKNYGNENGHLQFLSMEHFESFVGLQLARGLYGKHHSVELLWSSEFGVDIFGSTMTRQTFQDISRYLRFDVKQTRSMRIGNDPFTHIREVFDEFASNCRSHYIPHYSVCIDEQLMPLKCRCRFIVFMPNKPDKFGMKFWFLVDNQTKYIYNILPYLGSLEKASRLGEKLCDNVVNRLIQPLANKGYNVTCDNFFTNIELAKSLQRRKTSLVGTLRQNSKDIPSQLISENLQLHESAFSWNKQDNILLTKYQCKRKKSVMLLSTMHCNPDVDVGTKRKPDMIHFYNKNKFGVDCADAMLRLYTSRCATRRWPVAVWENLLDIALLNSWVCFKEATGSTISRKKFLMNLIQQLVKCKVINSALPATMPSATPEERSKCCMKMCKNRSKITCRICRNVFCGTHCPNPVEKVSLTTCEKCA